MTATTQFKIPEILEPALGREKATGFAECIEEVVDAKVQNETKMLSTKDDLYKTSVAIKEAMYKLSERLGSRIWATLITLVVMIFGSYVTIIFKH